MSRNIAGTDLSPSAVHAIVEIGLGKSISANDIGALLLLEKSSVSRLIQMLKNKALVKEITSRKDARVKLIELTELGKNKLKAIDKYAESRISASIEHLNNDDCDAILLGLNLFSDSLTKGRLNTP